MSDLENVGTLEEAIAEATANIERFKKDDPEIYEGLRVAFMAWWRRQELSAPQVEEYNGWPLEDFIAHVAQDWGGMHNVAFIADDAQNVLVNSWLRDSGEPEIEA